MRMSEMLKLKERSKTRQKIAAVITNNASLFLDKIISVSLSQTS